MPKLFSATSAEKSINFLIEHQCPQCGAPAVLDETDRLFTCEYCRVKSYLIQNGYPRYVFSFPSVKDREIIFFPFWRFKGMYFSCVSNRIDYKFVDISSRAVNLNFFPASVGLRSQALKLKFVSDEIKGIFLKPDIPFQKIINEHEKKIPNLKEKHPKKNNSFYNAYIGETISLIYSPFYINKKLYDAVLNKPLPSNLPNNFDINKFPAEKILRQVQFIPAVCPGCGWDITGQKDSLILICKNCNSVWKPDKNGLKQINFSFLPAKENSIYYMPFWRIKAEISGIDLNTHAALLKTANPAHAHSSGQDPEETGFYFWSPAFKVRPKIFIRIARSITIAQPTLELKEKFHVKLPDFDIHPVNLPVKEAVESLKINLAGFMKPAKKLFPHLPSISIKPKSFLLVYVPFNTGHHEFIQPEFNMAINKNMLIMAKNL